MINTQALQPLGDNWDIVKNDSKSLSHDQLEDIKKTAADYNTDGKLDKAIKGLEKLRSTVTDSISQFAADNGFQYVGDIGSNYTMLGVILPPREANNDYSSGITYYDNSTPAWMMGNGLQSMQQHAIKGFIHGFEFMILMDKLIVGQGDPPSNSIYAYSGVVAIQLYKTFPQILLDSNKNDRFGILKMAGSAIDPSQKVALEGNFSKYFDFYAPKGIHVNTLAVLAPNFMQMLIDASSNFDVEFYGDRMYMITKDPLYTEKVMHEAFDALEEQLRYLARLERSRRYEPLRPPFDVLKKTFLRNFYSVRIGSLRIGMVQLILFMFFLFVVAMYLFPFIFSLLV